MGLTYAEMLALMEMNQDPPEGGLMGCGEETRAMKVVRAGMNLRESEDDMEFWNDFMQLCSDSEGMAELLGVKSAEVKRWSASIRENIAKVQELNSTNPEGENQSRVMPTGDKDGAVTVDKDGIASETSTYSKNPPGIPYTQSYPIGNGDARFAFHNSRMKDISNEEGAKRKKQTRHYA